MCSCLTYQIIVSVQLRKGRRSEKDLKEKMMKNTILKNLAAAMAIAMLCAVSYAQNAKRIDFAKEGPHLVWEERVAANSSKSFVFYAKKGDKLSINFIDDTKMGSMDLGKVSIEPNEDPYEEVISVTKDYTLSVSNNSNKSTSFRIFISLEPAKTPAKPVTEVYNTVDAADPADFANAERITFPKGSIELNLERNAPASGAKRFVAWAKKGQTIVATATPSKKNAMLELSIGNKAVKGGETIEMVAPKTGDFFIQVTNYAEKSEPFTLDIGIADADRAGGDTSPSPAALDPSTAPNTERVKFSKDIIELNLQRTVQANNAKRFVFAAKQGQEVNLTVTPSRKNATLTISIDETMVKMRELFTMEIPKTGDYTIHVLNNDDRDQAFMLDMGLTDAERTGDTTDNSAPKTNGDRVSFAKGETSAMVTRDIPAEGSVDFVIGARKGQTLGYEVGYDFKDSDIKAFLTEPGLQDISKTSGPKARQEFVVKKSGDHRITVSNLSHKKVTITLYVDVE